MKIRFLFNYTLKILDKIGIEKEYRTRFGHYVEASKLVYTNDKNYIDIYLTNGDIIKDLNLQAIEIHGPHAIEEQPNVDNNGND